MVIVQIEWTRWAWCFWCEEFCDGDGASMRRGFVVCVLFALFRHRSNSSFCAMALHSCSPAVYPEDDEEET
jgi:hypothetical protein